MHKVQITLTPEETTLIRMRASRLGYDVTKFIKFLITREALGVADDIPTFQMSKKAERTLKKALEDHKAGKSLELKSLDDLDNL